ncbi:MAG: GIY-YIG nuclease family protein [candidate division Zixibacteria bacterium]|nr:GIY-YIG nuclease family protein [candidate division Zixibacteria bacterium]
MTRPAFVYFMTNKANRVLYTGVTTDLYRRVWEHQHHSLPGFTSRCNCTKLVLIEGFGDLMPAIEREKQIKNYNRAHKVRLIEAKNPTWRDLSEEF